MRYFLPVLFLLILASSCTQNQNLEGSNGMAPVEVEQVQFWRYAANLEPVKLPFTVTCDEELPASDLGWAESVIGRFGPEKGKIYGLLADTEKYTAILYTTPADISLPVIQTTDKEGNKISDLPLFEKYCGEDVYSVGTSWADITENRTIILSDSVVLYRRNEAGDIVENSKKTEVRHRTFTIADDGRINEKH